MHRSPRVRVSNPVEHSTGGGVDEVRQGKYLELDLAETDPVQAEAAVRDMCEKLLANTVIENYDIELVE